MNLRLVAALLLAAALPACISTSDVRETRGPAKAHKVSSIDIAPERSTVQVAPEAVARFQKFLEDDFYYKHGFQRGNQLKLRWRFTEFDQGNRALRYFVGFGAGNGKVVAHATFLDEKNRVVGAVEAHGRIVSGMFGGSYDTALRNCTDEINRYAEEHFLLER